MRLGCGTDTFGMIYNFYEIDNINLMMKRVNMLVKKLSNIWCVRRSPRVHHTVYGIEVRTPEDGGGEQHREVGVGRVPPVRLVAQHSPGQSY